MLTDVLHKATELHKQGRLDEAEILYRQILDNDPRHSDALNRLAIVALQRGDLQEALSRIDLALCVTPEAVTALSNKGAILLSLKRYPEALAIYDRVIALKTDDPDGHYNRARVLTDLNRHKEALASYDQVITLRPNDAEAYFNRGNALLELKRPEDALASYDQAIALNPSSAAAYYSRGSALLELKRPVDALASYDHAIALNPNNAATFYNRGNVLLELMRPEEALASYDQALAIKADFAQAFSNRGNALLDLERREDALASYDRAIALNHSNASTYYNRGNVLLELKRPEDALVSYDQAIALKSDFAQAFSNRGNALLDLRRREDALASYDRAITIKPDFAQAFSNRGNALLDLGRPEDALANYEQAIAFNPNSAEVYNNRANALRDLGRSGDSLTSYVQALAIDPNNSSAFAGFAHAALLCCDWKKQNWAAQLIDQKVNGDNIDPSVMLGYPIDHKILIGLARNYIRSRIPLRRTPLYQRAPRHHNRIRVAYLSGDFRVHATAHLIAELFEVHDRVRFEIIGVSHGKNDRSSMRSRLERAFDKFHDVSNVSDADTAKLLQHAEIDIAVDLNGYTRGGRPEIFAFRPAPVQVNYLGYPGTLGADFIDYIIADPIVLPFDQQIYYTEKIVHLADCYQVNDRKRAIASVSPTRKAEGLPEVGFVFCCFNNNYKITQEFFDIWMRLLMQVPGSVLWLLRDNETAQHNLRREAAARGIAPTRLVFAERLAPDQHLARHSLADLFLDTLPYNAHTTGSDALFAGLPMVTCMGETFPGRVAASLLRAIGLPNLVTTSALEYEQLAQRLANTPSELGLLRTRLRQNRLMFPLFNTDRFVRQIEAAYVRMWERSQSGLLPESFSVTAMG